MRRFFQASLMALAVGIGGVAALPQAADAMTVQPVVIDLQTSGRQMTQVVTVENTFANPLPVELRVEELTFDENGVHSSGTQSDDLLVFPPQALIQPGQTQTFRIQYVGDPALRREDQIVGGGDQQQRCIDGLQASIDTVPMAGQEELVGLDQITEVVGIA